MTGPGPGNDYVKVHVTFSEADDKTVGGEYFWAKRTDVADEFIIDNIPFFASRPTYGDRVRGIWDGSFYEVDHVVARSEWISCQVIASVAAVRNIRAAFKDAVRYERGFGEDDESLWGFVVRADDLGRFLDWLRMANLTFDLAQEGV